MSKQETTTIVVDYNVRIFNLTVKGVNQLETGAATVKKAVDEAILVAKDGDMSGLQGVIEGLCSGKTERTRKGLMAAFANLCAEHFGNVSIRDGVVRLKEDKEFVLLKPVTEGILSYISKPKVNTAKKLVLKAVLTLVKRLHTKIIKQAEGDEDAQALAEDLAALIKKYAKKVPTA